MKDFFRSIDTVGYTPKIYFKEKNKFKTTLGGILTLMITILTILATISFGEDIYRRTNPMILFNKNFIVPELNITQQEIIGYRLFYTGGVKIEELKRLVDVFLVHSVFDPRLSKSIITRHEMIKCGEADIYKNNYLNFSNLISNPDNYFCLPNDLKFFLKGKYGAPINNHMHLRIGICKNSTANKNACYPDEIIREKMSSFFVSFIYRDSYIDAKDFENPVKYYITSNTLKSSSYTFRQDAYLLKDITFKTDKGFILPDQESKEYTQLDNIQSGSTAESKTEIFTNVIVGLTNLKDFYSRKYIKVQDVSAQVGGIIKFFLIFCDFLISFYSYVPFLEALYSSIYDYNEFNKNGREIKISNSGALQNSDANLVIHNFAKNKSGIPNLINADRQNLRVNEIIHLKNIKGKIIPKSHSFLEIILRYCRNKKKYLYLDKITSNYTNIYDVERIFLNEFKISNLFTYTFNKAEQELIKLGSNIKFFEIEKSSASDHEFFENNSSISNSKIFKRLNIPRNLMNEKNFYGKKPDEQDAHIKFHSIKK